MLKYRLAGRIVAFSPMFDETAREMRAYLYEGEQPPETVFSVSREQYEQEKRAWLDEFHTEIETRLIAEQFYTWLLSHDGSYLHGCAVEMDGAGYVFTADSGTGKSTHCALWKQRFGRERVHVLNDDKPFVRIAADGTARVCGSPWCGKVPVNQSAEAPLAGICLLRQAERNSIRRLPPAEAGPQLLRQIYLPDTEERMDEALALLERLMQAVPIWELACNISEEAAQLSYDTMKPGETLK
ncbi:MAG: hypothetical protein PHY12_08855 [Eubacteriales bacterium]|nr:hypothetical protein [Eubacteriales bacterium]